MLYSNPGSAGAVINFKLRYENFIGGEWVAPVKGQYMGNISPINDAAVNQPADIATLSLLMAQYQLSTADIPEIYSKSMVSRVLSGERSMNKNHIKALADRFQISPNLIF